MADLQHIHEALLKLEKRAERSDDEKLTETFVDAVPLIASVSTRDNQVIFGRRGTGKTHVLKVLHDRARATGEVAVYMDLRSVGSNGSLYSDMNKNHAERATPLLLDVLQALHERLVELAVDDPNCDLSVVGPKLDELAESISRVEVAGQVETLDERASLERIQDGGGLTISAPAKIELTGSHTQEAANKAAIRRTGRQIYYVKFGDVQSRIKAVLSLLAKRVWLLLDEWSEVPLDLQPYLADLLRRCVVPLSEITMKIAAIEHRTNLIVRNRSDYVGLELGADVGADVNLDDFMVFDNDEKRATVFFANLLFRHCRANGGTDEKGPHSAQDLVRDLFTQFTAFEEFVRAVEGVPRDAVFLVANAIRKAYGRKITINDVRTAARDWYQRDKATVLKSHQRSAEFLRWTVEEVIAHRRTRAFLYPSDGRNELIETLFDSRLLHILKKNISSNDEPGVRYDVYKIDYGSYVDLITTTRAPSGLLPTDENGVVAFTDVPPDDYRSIRRAILKTEEFDKKYPLVAV